MLKGKPFVKWAGGKRQIMDELKKQEIKEIMINNGKNNFSFNVVGIN